ncbi:hypothetical protein ElyMa_000184900 [Elysia marginata]|uniref:Rab3 GTPase-activating protein catalytic subunit n=1 Tax=Elysia marginata TaxID=1093978 RepID=A0AAV4EUT4_9GAST|nr:hypothetical protein ElyMa_000184900 [Elysia marginata]
MLDEWIGNLNVEESVEWTRWESISSEKGTRIDLRRKKGSVGELMEELKKEAIKLPLHDFVQAWQLKQYFISHAVRHSLCRTREGETSLNLFQAAGEEFEEDTEVSDPVRNDISSFINRVFSRKTKSEKLRDKASALKRPENCPTLATPLTNPETWAVLKGHAKRNDSKLTAIQSYVGKSAVAVARCADKLAASHPAETKQLIDALILLGHAHHCLTLQRKDHQRYALPWDIRGIIM